MRVLVAIVLLSVSAWVCAAVRTDSVTYEVRGVQHQGILAYDDAAVGKPPGILVFPEWWGANEYVKGRARMLAELGYVAFVADMYGGGKTTTNAQEAQELAKGVYADPDVLVSRASAALQALQQSGKADANRFAAIGYCMGGTVALNLARTGADLKAVVGFHCGLQNLLKESPRMTAKILVCTGADDKMVPQEQRQAFELEMQQAKADWTHVILGGAMHAFTNPEADRHKELGTIGYHQGADRRSWQMMRNFLAEVLEHRPAAAAERGIGSQD